MSGFDYTASAATASHLISYFGGPVALYRKTGGGTGNPYDRAADTYAPEVVTAVDLAEKRMAEGVGLVATGERVLLMKADAAPAQGDRVEIGGALHEISQIEPLRPSGLNVMFKVRVKSNG